MISTRTITSLLKEEGILLESVRAPVTADRLVRGFDLLRTPGNEITFIAGRTGEDQVWQSVRVSTNDPSISVRVSLSVGTHIVGEFSVGKKRLDRMRLVARGATVRAIARSDSAPSIAVAWVTLEIFGWGVTQEMVHGVEEALRFMEMS